MLSGLWLVGVCVCVCMYVWTLAMSRQHVCPDGNKVDHTCVQTEASSMNRGCTFFHFTLHCVINSLSQWHIQDSLSVA